MAKKVKNADKNTKPNPFSGSNDIYLTKNKIAVINVSSTSSERGYTLTKKTKYYARNDKNLRQLKKVTDTVRVGRTGTKYTRL